MKAAFQWEERNISKLLQIFWKMMITIKKVAQTKADKKCQDREEDCILISVVSVCLTKVTFEQRI